MVDAYRKTIEIQQHTHTFKDNCCLKVHNAPLKLPLPISVQVYKIDFSHSTKIFIVEQ